MKSTQHYPGKVAYWSAHIKKWERSGLLQRNYCARQGISEKSFWRWKRILEQSLLASSPNMDETEAEMPKQLIPVSIFQDEPDQELQKQSQPQLAGIRLHVQDKYAIDVAVGFHAGTLEQLLGILSRP